MKFFVGIFIPGVFAIQVKKEGSASSALDAGDVLVTSPHDDHDGNITFSKTPPFGPWECYAELDFPTTWYEYCDAPSPKSFSMNAKCDTASYSSGVGSGVAMAAINDCQGKAFGEHCYTYDNNGYNCHLRYCHPSAVNADEFAEYCSNRDKSKAWFQADDCYSFGWADQSDSQNASKRLIIAQERCEMRSGGQPCFLVDDGGATRGPQCMPTCAQDLSNWCWATSAAQIATVFAPHDFKHSGPDSCHRTACDVASRVDGRACCNYYNESVVEWNKQCDHGQDITKLKNWLKANTGQSYEANLIWAPSEGDLKRLLLKGPVVALVSHWSWDLSNFGFDFQHYITIAGTNNRGDYWVTDTLQYSQVGNGFAAKTYDQIRNYLFPGIGMLKWYGSFYPK